MSIEIKKSEKSVIYEDAKKLMEEKISKEMPMKEKDNEKNIKSNSVVFITTQNLLIGLNNVHN